MRDERSEDLGYESTYLKLRPESERQMSTRLAQAIDRRHIEPAAARALGVPTVSEMLNALLWATHLKLIAPDWALELGIAQPRRPSSSTPSISWAEARPSESQWERAAFAYLRRGLEEHGGPHRAWTNLEFVDNDAVSEVDALVVVPSGVFLIEIKSWPGLLEGDAAIWTLTRPAGGGIDTLENPLCLADRKAKRLQSLLQSRLTYANSDPPFIPPLVFLSHPELDCRLDQLGREGVVGRDDRGVLPGVVARLARSEPVRVDERAAERLAQELDELGIRPNPQTAPPPVFRER